MSIDNAKYTVEEFDKLLSLYSLEVSSFHLSKSLSEKEGDFYDIQSKKDEESAKELKQQIITIYSAALI